MKKLTCTLAALGLGLALAAPASALIQFYNPTTAFQDDDLDYVVDTNNNGIIDIGDRLIAVIEMANTQGVLPGQGPTPIAPEELTGVADITVVNVLANGTLVFAASGAAGVLSAFAPGTAVAFWTDATPDLNVINAACGTRAACLLAAGLGAGDPLFFTGLLGPGGTFWTSLPATGGAIINNVQTGGSSTTFGAFNFGLTVGVNNTGQVFNSVTGSGNILGGEFLDPTQWTARSDADAQVRQIPEPGSVLLLGAALAGLGLMRLRSKSA